MTAIGVKSPGMSNGSDFSTLGKITTLFDTMPSVVPVGCRARQRLQADDAAGARLVVDDDRLAERLGQRGCAARVIASTPEPVAFGSTRRTVRSCRLGWQRMQQAGGRECGAEARADGGDGATGGGCSRSFEVSPVVGLD